MSFRNRIVLPVVLSALALLAGCGSSSNSGGTVNPPPTGGFTNSNLNGTYVFSFSGTDVTNSSFFSIAGILTANGNGGITGGSIDLIDPALSPSVNQAVAVQSNSGYSITADGRGKGALVTSSFGNIGFDFVLSSSSHGMIIRFDQNGTGSGTLDLQDTSVTQSGLTSYAFSFSGTGTNALFSTVGNFTLNGGTSLTGLQDFNDGFNSTNLQNLALGGSLTLGSGGAVGTSTFATAAPYGSLTFDVWAIDKTHLKLIETDGTHWTVGDAYTEQPTVNAGQLVYTAAGIDTSSSLFSSGGFMTYDGSSAISNGLQDMNDGGTINQSLTVSGTLSSTGSGRYGMTLNGLYNGVNNSVGSYAFAAYPFTSGGTTGVFILETDGAGMTGGTVFLQSAQTFASGQGYALNLTGANGASSVGEVDAVAEFTTNSGGTLSNGVIDENNGGTTGFKLALGTGGTYSFDSPPTGRGILSYPSTQTAAGTLDLAFYVVDSSTSIFIEGDSTQLATGAFQVQNTPTKAGLAHTSEYVSVLRAASSRMKRQGQK